jgi:hypothetical protein
LKNGDQFVNTLLTLNLHNRHHNPIAVYYLPNPSGEDSKRELQYTLNPNEQVNQYALAEDVWLFLDAATGEEVRRHTVTQSEELTLRLERSKHDRQMQTFESIDALHRSEFIEPQHALFFDGDNDIIIIPDRRSGLSWEGSWTLEAWIWRASSAARHPIIDNTDGADGGYFLQIGANNKLQAGIQQGGQRVYSESESEIPAQTWTHVAATFDASSTIACFINGEPVNTIRHGFDEGERLRAGLSDEGLSIAKSTGTDPSFFHGKIDAIRIWDRRRTAGEIKDGWQRRLSGRNAGLRALYRLDVGRGEKAYDSSGARHHAQFEGAPAWRAADWGSDADNQFVLEFDGQDDALIVPHKSESDLNLTGAFTLEAWIFRQAEDRVHPIIDKTSHGQGGYFLRVGDNNRLQGGIRKGKTLFYLESDEPIQAMRWYHVALSMDPLRYRTPLAALDGEQGVMDGAGGQLYLDGRSTPATWQHQNDPYYGSVVADLTGQRHFLLRRELLERTQAFTVEAWIKPTQPTAKAVPPAEQRHGVELRHDGRITGPALLTTEQAKSGVKVEYWFKGNAMPDLLFGPALALGSRLSAQVGDGGSSYSAPLPKGYTDSRWHHVQLSITHDIKPVGEIDLEHLDEDRRQDLSEDLSYLSEHNAYAVLYQHVVTIDGQRAREDEIGLFGIEGPEQPLSLRYNPEFVITIADSHPTAVTAVSDLTVNGVTIPFNEGQGNTAVAKDETSGEQRTFTLNEHTRWLDATAPDATASNMTIMAARPIFDKLFLLRIDEADGQGRLVSQLGDLEVVSSEACVTYDVWQHIAVAWQAGEFLRIFHNGRQVGETNASALNEAINFGAHLHIGADPGGEPGLEGEMAALRVWRRALAEKELGLVYRRRLPADTDGLAADWRLDEGWLDDRRLPTEQIVNQLSDRTFLSPNLAAANAIRVGGQSGKMMVSSLTLPDQATLEAWVNLTEKPQSGQLLFSADQWRLLFQQQGSQLQLAYVAGDETPSAPPLMQQTIPDSGWMHIALVHSLETVIIEPALAFDPAAQMEQQVAVSFKNNTELDLNLLTFDSAGMEKRVQTLLPNDEWTGGSYPGQVWRFVDLWGRAIGERRISAADHNQTIAIERQQRHQVSLYVTPAGAAESRIVSGTIAAVPGQTDGKLALGSDNQTDASLALSEIRLWDGARDGDLLDRFRYHQYAAVQPNHPELLGLWLSDAAHGEDASPHKPSPISRTISQRRLQ